MGYFNGDELLKDVFVKNVENRVSFRSCEGSCKLRCDTGVFVFSLVLKRLNVWFFAGRFFLFRVFELLIVSLF